MYNMHYMYMPALVTAKQKKIFTCINCKEFVFIPHKFLYGVIILETSPWDQLV